MRLVGLLLIAIALALPLWWFVPLAAEHDAAAVFSQYLGSSALIVMAFAQLLATRARILEPVFGGLDRIYVLHKWLAIGALGALLLHDTIDADLPDLGPHGVANAVGDTFGELSLYGLIVLIIITIATFVPYHLWRWTHKLIGIFFALGAVHFLLIAKPFEAADPAGLYVGAFCAVGVLAYLYALLPFRWMRGRFSYEVAAVEPTGDVLAVTLKPRGRGIAHRAGQFAFFSFDSAEISEVHPFTISKAPDAERVLRVTVKQLGDFTARLDGRLRPGVRVAVSPSYGHFIRAGRRPEIWIAGGIGITPFLAWAEGLDDNGEPVHLFYCVSERSAAAHLTELEAIAEQKPRFHLHVVVSKTDGRLTVQQIVDRIGVPLGQVEAAFCGPEAMRKALREALEARGLPRGRFRFEAFEIRSGVGLRRILFWLLKIVIGRLEAQQTRPAT